MWRTMDDHPKDKPFGVVTKSGKARLARYRNTKLVYLVPHWSQEHQRAMARQDPPYMRWDGPLPILPKDIERLMGQRTAAE